MMTRAVGVEPDVEVDRFVETARHGDRYLLCSDGLPRELNDDLIASMLRRFRDAGEAARELVAEAKRRGGNDNITVVVVDIVDTDLDDPTAVVPLTAPADDAGEAEGAAMVPAAAGAAGADGAKKKPRTKRMKVPTTSPLTVRVVGFILLLLVVIGAGLGGLLWYGRSGYFVTTKGSEIVVYQGRPGGVLWIKPTLAKVTSHTTDQVLPSDLQSLHSGQQESSLGASVAYVDRLYAQYQQAQLAAGPTTTVPTSTTTSSTATTRPASATTRVSTATTRASTVTSRAVPTTARP
jgi:protein phosphatase